MEIPYPRFDIVTKTSEFNMRLPPTTIAISHSPARRLWHAMCRAVRAVEQAVSMETLGPRRSKKCDMRLASMARALPVTLYRGKDLGSRCKES